MTSLIDAFLDAQMEALEAARTDDETRQRDALVALRLARERVALAGELFMTLALDHGGELFLAKLRRTFSTFDETVTMAERKITRVELRTRQLSIECDALRSWIRMLEKRLDDLTPGVGEPAPRVPTMSATPFPTPSPTRSIP